MTVARVTSWKEYVLAVSQMRECQRQYFRTRSQTALGFAKAWEAAVDEATGRKIAEWVEKKTRRTKQTKQTAV
jgi:hypothetical protein